MGKLRLAGPFRFLAALGAACLLGAAPAMAQAQAGIPIAVPPPPGAIWLYPGIAPGSAGASQTEKWTQFADGRRTRNGTVPILIPVLPSAGKANGTAVIVAPRGAFRLLAMDKEGYEVANSLAQRGVNAFILKYRLVETPAAEEAFIRERQKGMAPGLESKPIHRPWTMAAAQYSC
jgi:hypothetical protein